MPVPQPHLTLHQAEQLALQLMHEHGVMAKGWVFQWSKGKRRLGEASIRTKRDRNAGKTKTIKAIRLSEHLVTMNPEPIVRDVILHEIAHALAGLENGHNHVWRAACQRIGANPQRLADETVQVVEGRYTIICGQCTQALGTRHRRPNPRQLARAYCKHCGPASAGKLKLVTNVKN